MHKILVATDFSPCSEAALDLALELARRTRASLTLLHVGQLPAYAYYGALYVSREEALRSIEQDARAGLLAARQRLSGHGVEIDTQCTVGEAASEIVRFARAHGYDLIILGTHGRRGLRRLLLGSVAEMVVRTAEVPVLTAPQPAQAKPVNSVPS